jgi:hypothetical protein
MDLRHYINDYLIDKHLNENSLYKNQAERDALLKDKTKVVEAFLFNFLGILGLINGAANSNDVKRLKNYFLNDKKLFISSIGDDNNDISLSVRLMHDAEMFQTSETVNQITRFLARLKSGKVEPVDSRIIAGWLKKLKPDFIINIKDSQIKKAVSDFIKDGGENIDISSLAILLKRKMRKFEVVGDFREFAKRVKIARRNPPHKIGDSGVTTIDDMLKAAPVHSRSIKNVITATNKIQSTTLKNTNTTKTQDSEVKTNISKEISKSQSYPNKKITAKLSSSDMIECLFSIYRDYNINSIYYRYNKITKEDLETIKDFISSQDELIKNIMTLRVDTILGAFEKLANNINASNLVTNYVYPETIKYESSDIRKSDDVLDKYPLSSLIDSLYSYEIDNSNIQLLSFDEDHIKKIYESKLTYKNKLINAILDSKSYVDILDKESLAYDSINEEDSRSFKILAMYFMKVAKDNATLQQVLENIDRSFFPFKERIYNVIIRYLSLKSFPRDVYAGVNIKAAQEMQIQSIGFLNKVPYNMEKLILGKYEYENENKRKEFIFYDYIERKYKNDFIKNGFSNSDFFKKTPYLAGSFDLISKMIEDFDIDARKILQKHPSDNILMDFVIRTYGIDSLSNEIIKNYIEKSAIKNLRIANKEYFDMSNIISDEDVKKTYMYVSEVINQYKEIYRKSSNSEKINSVILEMIEENPKIYDNPTVFRNIIRIVPNMEKNSVIRLINIAKNNNFYYSFNKNSYNALYQKSEKDEFIAAFIGIVNDTIGTDLEDYISDILETMPNNVNDKVRQGLVGINFILEEINNGLIKPFDKIDDKRLKTILSMNDIDFTSIVKDNISRKKKSEKWIEYFRRIKETNKQNNILGNEKVYPSDEDTNTITKIYNTSFRSNKHGNIYAKINKIFTSDLEFPEFKKFRETNFGDGIVIPAFHGTGGIAATMILRYGFKVIKASDPSVVGRMLGNGIYFTNKIDKALQYIGNSGYGKEYGTKGYIIELDNTLGYEDKTKSENNPDYRVMGLGGDNIRSPEWCVRDPRKQLAIRKVYEVEIIPKTAFDKLLNENQKIKKFKEYLIEKSLMSIKNNVVSFIFRDGKIPIFNESGNIYFVDFEEAIKNNLISPNMIDYSMQGPVVVFDAADENKTFDIRFAEMMNGEAYQLYEKYFFKKVLRK